MLKEDYDCKIPKELVPYCPNCGETMEVNLRKDDYFVKMIIGTNYIKIMKTL